MIPDETFYGLNRDVGLLAEQVLKLSAIVEAAQEQIEHLRRRVTDCEDCEIETLEILARRLSCPK